MTTNSVSLTDLMNARANLLSRVGGLKADLENAEGELDNLNVLIAAFERYAGIQTPSDVVVPEPARAGVGGLERGMTSRKRIPSTQMVGELVQKSGHKLTREDIRNLFESTYGIPANWANPVNALNNAISRAEVRGLIQEFPDGTFAKPGEYRSW